MALGAGAASTPGTGRTSSPPEGAGATVRLAQPACASGAPGLYPTRSGSAVCRAATLASGGSGIRPSAPATGNEAGGGAACWATTGSDPGAMAAGATAAPDAAASTVSDGACTGGDCLHLHHAVVRLGRPGKQPDAHPQHTTGQQGHPSRRGATPATKCPNAGATSVSPAAAPVVRPCPAAAATTGASSRPGFGHSSAGPSARKGRRSPG
jgi:hypothetical protein